MSKRLETLLKDKEKHLDTDFKTDKQAEVWANKLAKLDEKILKEEELQNVKG